jgi:hypothetical protein
MHANTNSFSGKWLILIIYIDSGIIISILLLIIIKTKCRLSQLQYMMMKPGYLLPNGDVQETSNACDCDLS